MVFGCISKNFPENIFWCLEKKKDNTNPEKHKPQPRKKSRSTAREEDPRSRSTLRKIAPSIAISRKSRDRDRAVDRDQWRGRRTGFVVVDDFFLGCGLCFSGFVFSFFFSKHQKIFSRKFFEMKPNTWKYFPFPKISISGKYIFSGKRFTATKHSLRVQFDNIT